MEFYDLSKEERSQLVATIHNNIFTAFQTAQQQQITAYLEDKDTYIRKAAYTAIGRTAACHHSNAE
jgi:hypothetical protein